jgi:hypothetical protein
MPHSRWLAHRCLASGRQPYSCPPDRYEPSIAGVPPLLKLTVLPERSYTYQSNVSQAFEYCRQLHMGHPSR